MNQPLLVGGTTVLLRAGSACLETLLIRRPDRGSFAGAWVFPGGVVEDGDAVAGAPEHETAARAAARECDEEVGLRPTDLHALSCWVPPIEAPKRVRTWFFLAQAPEGEVRAAPDEVVDAVWMSPADVLRRHADGEMVLFPPTWVTLRSLAEHETFADAVAAASVPDLFSTHLVGGGIFAWEGDAEHPEGGMGRHRIDTSTLPWEYVRD
ncbi:NUDIX hydrolase [Microbacterium sp.]|uniref:NUDIX hydrolase n=1 Tax=Microbacterium sp. TaxID=51671 RepID=UPI003F9A65B6